VSPLDLGGAPTFLLTVVDGVIGVHEHVLHAADPPPGAGVRVGDADPGPGWAPQLRARCIRG
jgi:hypothetical protein